MLRNVSAVFLKEVRALTRSPLLYVLGAVFLGLSGYFFYTDVLYFDLLNQDKVSLTQGLWQRLFEDLRLCLLTVAPVLAARVFAEEWRLGTMEMLLTYPLTERELVYGKLLSLLVLFLPLLAVTLVYPFSLAAAWPVDPWPLVAVYVGTALLGTVCLSCGMLTSVLASQQSTAALSALGILFFFWFLAWNEGAVSPALVDFERRLSLFDRFYDFTRGTIQSRDVAYFVVATVLLVQLTVEALRWRWHVQRRSGVLRIALVAALAVAIEQWSFRQNHTWDLVQQEERTLAPESRKLLAALEVPVHLTVFYEAGRYPELSYLAEGLKRASSKVTVDLVNLDREPALARKFRVQAYNTIVVESGGRSEVVAPAEEPFLMRAIAAVTDPRPRLVCVSTGHRESEMIRDRREKSEEAGSLDDLFESVGYRWQEVALEEEKQVPEGCRILFVNGPKIDFRQSAIEAADRYVDGGGSALFLVDPAPLPRIEAWLRQYHVALGVEVESTGDERLYLRDRYTLPVVDVVLSAKAPERFTGVFYGARRVDYSGDRATPTGVAFLGYRSRAEGLIPVGVAAELREEEGGGRLIVAGDSDFVAGSLFERNSNRSLFLGMLGWVAQRNIAHPRTDKHYAFTPLTRGNVRRLTVVAVAPPLLLLGCGGFAWWLGRPRRRGAQLAHAAEDLVRHAG